MGSRPWLLTFAPVGLFSLLVLRSPISTAAQHQLPDSTARNNFSNCQRILRAYEHEYPTLADRELDFSNDSWPPRQSRNGPRIEADRADEASFEGSTDLSPVATMASQPISPRTHVGVRSTRGNRAENWIRITSCAPHTHSHSNKVVAVTELRARDRRWYPGWWYSVVDQGCLAG